MNFQVTDGFRKKPPKVELFTPDEQRSIYRRWRCHDKTIWELAREKRVTTRDIDEVIKSQSNRELAKAREDAWKEGRNSVFPPCHPKAA